MSHIPCATETLFLIACLDIHEGAVEQMTNSSVSAFRGVLWLRIERPARTVHDWGVQQKAAVRQDYVALSDCYNPGAISHGWETALHRQTTLFHTICLDALESGSFSLGISTSKEHSDISIKCLICFEWKQTITHHHLLIVWLLVICNTFSIIMCFSQSRSILGQKKWMT